MHWWKKLKARVHFKEPLSAHTTLRVGGPAQVWVKPDHREGLKELIRRLAKEKVPYLILGRGSNVLFSDQGFKGAVVCLSSAAFAKVKINKIVLSCGAGLSLNKLLKAAELSGLGGLEFLAGVPASVGGALVINAGSRAQGIGDLVKTVKVMDKAGKIRRLNKAEAGFNYRRSNLDKYIVLEATFKLARTSPEIVRENIAANLSRKRKTQDLSAKSAGCVFKNPCHRLTAAQMIEACGLKKASRGGAQISAKHANYIINKDMAKARDILYLIDLARKQVKKKFGVTLEPEIKIIR